MPSKYAYRTGSEKPSLEKGQLRLYSMLFCPFAQRARLLLALKGVPYETVNISLMQKPAWVLDLNPNGTVPILEKDGQILFESLIVSEYLDQVFPTPKVSNPDPYGKARDAMLIDYYGNKYISGYYKVIFNGTKDEGNEAAKTVNTALQRLEDELSQRKTTFFAGEKAGYIDFMIWPWLERLPVLPQFNPEVKMEAAPRVCTWREDMFKLPCVQECLQTTEHHVEFYNKWIAKDNDAFDVGLPKQ